MTNNENRDEQKLRAVRALQRFVMDTRRDKRLTQRQVAERGGLSKGSVAFLESTTHFSLPRQPTLMALAKGLGVQYVHLDRIIRGLPPEPTAATESTAALLDECSPAVRALLLEYSTWPDHLRQAFESGLTGLVTGIRQAQTP